MTIAFKCVCGKRYRVDDTAANRKLRCKQCGQTLRVPAGQPAESSPKQEAHIPRKRKRPAAESTSSEPAESSRFPDDFFDDDATPAGSRHGDPGEREENRGSSAQPSSQVVPPVRRRRKPRPSTPIEPQPKSRPQRARPDPERTDDEEDEPPLISMSMGLFSIGAGIWLYYHLKELEEVGGSIPIWLYAAHEFLGKTGVMLFFCVGGAIGLISGLVKWIRQG